MKEKLPLLTDFININDLQYLFSLKREGLHIKPEIDGLWKNVS